MYKRDHMRHDVDPAKCKCSVRVPLLTPCEAWLKPNKHERDKDGIHTY